jgi:hypothetical protein
MCQNLDLRFFPLLPFVSFFLPFFRFFDLTFYYLFSFFDLVFYRPLFFPSFSLLFCTCWLMWFHL